MQNEKKKPCSVNLETVINNLISAIVVLDRDSSIILANNMAAFFADKTKSEMIGLRVGKAFNCVNADVDPAGCGFSPECQFCEIRNTFEKSFIDKCNITFRDTSLELREVGLRDFRFTTTYLAKEDLVILAMEDITDMKVMENERLQKGRLIGAIETAGAICHEMNQPLQVISGYLDLMADKRKKYPPGDSKRLDTMRQQLHLLSEITRKLQNIQRFAEKEYIEGQQILDIEKSTSVA